MRRSLAFITWLKGYLIQYYLLGDQNGQAYGLAVSYRGEEAAFSDLTASAPAIRELLHAMRKGTVTPVTAGDIVEDWLLR